MSPIFRRVAGPTVHRIIGARTTALEGVKGFSQYWRALFYGPQIRPISGGSASNKPRRNCKSNPGPEQCRSDRADGD